MSFNDICYDALEIIKDYAGQEMRSRFSKEYYMKIFNEKKGNQLYEYLVKKEADGLARELLINHYIKQKMYIYAYNLCRTMDQVSLVFNSVNYDYTHQLKVYHRYVPKDIPEYCRIIKGTKDPIVLIRWFLYHKIHGIVDIIIELDIMPMILENDQSDLLKNIFALATKKSTIYGLDMNDVFDTILTYLHNSFRDIPDNNKYKQLFYDTLAKDLRPEVIMYMDDDDDTGHEIIDILVHKKYFISNFPDNIIGHIIHRHPHLFIMEDYPKDVLNENFIDILASSIDIKIKDNIVMKHFEYICKGYSNEELFVCLHDSISRDIMLMVLSTMSIHRKIKEEIKIKEEPKIRIKEEIVYDDLSDSDY